jgi:hypothetical protein
MCLPSIWERIQRSETASIGMTADPPGLTPTALACAGAHTVLPNTELARRAPEVDRSA